MDPHFSIWLMVIKKVSLGQNQMHLRPIIILNWGQDWGFVLFFCNIFTWKFNLFFSKKKRKQRVMALWERWPKTEERKVAARGVKIYFSYFINMKFRKMKWIHPEDYWNPWKRMGNWWVFQEKNSSFMSQYKMTIFSEYYTDVSINCSSFHSQNFVLLRRLDRFKTKRHHPRQRSWAPPVPVFGTPKSHRTSRSFDLFLFALA